MRLLNLSSSLSPMEKIKICIIGGFSALVGIAFLVSLGSMVYFKVKDSTSEIGVWMNVFLTCLGYIVGILTGLLGLPTPNPPAPSKG